MPDKIELKSGLLSYKKHLLELTRNKITEERGKILAIKQKNVMRDPLTRINDNRRELLYLSEALSNFATSDLERNKNKFSNLAGKLDALSPLKVISRGFALVENNGRVVTSKKQVDINDDIILTVSDGVISARVTDINEE